MKIDIVYSRKYNCLFFSFFSVKSLHSFILHPFPVKMNGICSKYLPDNYVVKMLFRRRVCFVLEQKCLQHNDSPFSKTSITKLEQQNILFFPDCHLPKEVHFRFIAVQIDVYGRNEMASCVLSEL